MSASCVTWTLERIELLKRCLDAGLSCRQTAREIGVTRNAVIGKINRLGLIAAQGCGPRAARGKTCHNARAPEDFNDLVPKALAPEHLRRA
jgi:GcrA cell cycle regulator